MMASVSEINTFLLYFADCYDIPFSEAYLLIEVLEEACFLIQSTK